MSKTPGAAACAETEYRSHVTLMLIGHELDPRVVSTVLGMRPTRSWKRGELKRAPSGRVLSGEPHSHGGWKKSLPASELTQPLSRQLRFWVVKLRGKARAISDLSGHGNVCALSCYVGTSDTASIILPAALQSDIGALGLELRLSFFAET